MLFFVIVFVHTMEIVLMAMFLSAEPYCVRERLLGDGESGFWWQGIGIGNRRKKERKKASRYITFI